MSGSRRSKDFTITDGPRGRTLVVTGLWSKAAAKALNDPTVDGLDVNYAHGCRERDLEFLQPLPIRRLHVLARTYRDLSPVYRLAETLEDLSFEVAPTASIDLALLPHLRHIGGSWHQIRRSINSAPHVERLFTMHYNEPNFEILTANESLRTVILKGGSRSLQSLDGIEQLPWLSALRIYIAPGLADLSALHSAARGATEIAFGHCTGITCLDDIGDKPKLQFLECSDCGEIASLQPISGLLNLEDLHLWGTTRIADNNLQPILGLSKLTDLRIQARRSYRPSVAEIREGLGIA